MKLLCTSDLHLGAGAEFGQPDSVCGSGSRLHDQEQIWLGICELAIEEKVDLLLLAGDAFHRRRPTPWELLAFRSGLNELRRHSVPVIAICGNHEVTAADLPTALDVFADEIEIYTTPHVRVAERVAVAVLPWAPAAHVVAERGGGDRDQLHRDVGDILVDAARQLHDQARRANVRDDGPAILLAHWSVGSAITPTGMSVDDLREPVIPLHALKEIGFDWIVLGHIHAPQKLDQAGRVFYCGSPCVVDFGEADTSHGVWIIDTDEGTARFEHVPDRAFVTLDYHEASVDLLADGRFARATREGGPELDVAGAVVRVRYRCTPEQARRVDHHQLREALLAAGAHRVYAIQPEIIRPDRARAEGVDETLTAWDALDRWLATQYTGRNHERLLEKAYELFAKAGVS